MIRKELKVGVVGATGMVGQTFLNIIEEREWQVSELRLFASDASRGKKILAAGKEWPVQALGPKCFDGLDVVFFSSGDDISKEWGPQAVQSGAWAIDNSAAFRMDPATPLIVPEVNGDLISDFKNPLLIANPNCSTIQLVVALEPLKAKFGLREVRVASYQSVSGAGQAAYDELLKQTEGLRENPHPKPSVFPHVIAFNCIPHIGSFDGNGYTSEEMKVMRETRKILRAPELKVSAFTVRVPTLNAHAEAVWVTFDREVERAQVISAFEEAPGVVIQDEPSQAKYPLQRSSSGQDPVFVGRIHRDLEDSRTWLMWIVSDNLRKGAALNGVQIAERIFDKP